VPPQQLFFSYLYFSSFSESYLRHAQRMAHELCERFGLGANSTVVEIASNDGYLLQYFQQRGVRVLGIDPAENIGEAARKRGIPTWTRFFGQDLLPELEEAVGKVDVIIGNNVLAHVPEINAFLSAVHGALAEGGHAVFEFPYVRDLLEKNEYDTIYHEHVYYFSLSAIKALAERAGLDLIDVSHQSVHGGTLRVFLGKDTNETASASVTAMLANERSEGLVTPERFETLGRDVERQVMEFVLLLRNLRKAGNSIAAYGAPAKGNTLLNTCGIDNSLIDFTVDKNEHKQGLLLPGSRIPILAPESLLERQPDFAVILPWNLAKEIVEQQAEYVSRGGRFILPIPFPSILNPEAAAVAA